MATFSCKGIWGGEYFLLDTWDSINKEEWQIDRMATVSEAQHVGNHSIGEWLTFPNLQSTEIWTKHQHIHSQCKGSHFRDQNSHVPHKNTLLPSIKEPGIEIINPNTAWWTHNQIQATRLILEAISAKLWGELISLPDQADLLSHDLTAYITHIQHPSRPTALDTHCLWLPILWCIYAPTPFSPVTLLL